MFGPSLLVSPSPLPFIGWALVAAATMASADSSAHRRRIYAEASPGKNILLQFTPAASTAVDWIVAFGLLCNLNHPQLPLMQFLFVGANLCSPAYFTAGFTTHQLAAC